MNTAAPLTLGLIPVEALGRVVTGRTPPGSRDGLFGDRYPFLTPTDIDGVSRYVQSGRFLSEEGSSALSTIVLPKGTTCVVCIGATIGKTCMTDQISFCNQQINAVVVNEDRYDPFFVYYLMTSLAQRLKAEAGGSATPILNKSTFSKLLVSIPVLKSEQTLIARLVGAYDDLIENNLRRIRLLEEMSRALYREWFVRHAPKIEELVATTTPGHPTLWSLGRLDDALVLQRGFDLPISQRVPGAVPVHAATGVVDFHREAKVRAPGVVTGRSGTIGVVQFVQDDFWPLNTALWVKEFRAVEPLIAYFLLKELDLRQFNSGAAVPTLNRNDIHGLQTLIPPPALQARFVAAASPMLAEVRVLSRAVANLRKTRDLLLPRLLSGQLRLHHASGLHAKAVSTALDSSPVR